MDRERERLCDRVKPSRIHTSAYARHKQLMQLYQKPETIKTKLIPKSDLEELKEHFRFVLPEIPEGCQDTAWQLRMVRQYYNALFKEYAVCDLSKTTTDGVVAMRWRTEAEVICGKGQFECGNVSCKNAASLTDVEVNFAYVEQGTKKNALVKVSLCHKCLVIIELHQNS